MVVATPVLPRILRLSSCGAPSPPASSLRVLRRRCRRCAGAAGAGGLDGGIMRSAQPISGLIARNDVAKKVLAKARGVWYFSVNIACSSGQTGERTSGRSQAEAQHAAGLRSTFFRKGLPVPPCRQRLLWHPLAFSARWRCGGSPPVRPAACLNERAGLGRQGRRRRWAWVVARHRPWWRSCRRCVLGDE